MIKADLIEKVAKDAGVNKVQADAAINSLLDGVLVTLKKGGAVTLVGFGTFSVGNRKAENRAAILKPGQPSRSRPRRCQSSLPG